MATPRICSVNGCDKPVRRRNWCGMHYQRWVRHGDVTLRARPGNGEAVKYYREVVLAYEGDECLIWPYAKTPAGYGHISGEKYSVVSRLVCEEEHGPPPTPEHQAAHSCGRGHDACVTKRHVSWKTSKENNADKLTHGTHSRGERQWLSKLTEADVKQIRSLQGEMTNGSIAKKFGISHSHVSSIQSRVRWDWLE